MGDIKLFRIGKTKVQQLGGKSLALERSLQTMIEKHLEELLGVRFLATEYSTGKTHRGRIDTLGIDENGCPVIIEYKRATNENVINQGLFYLDWLMDHKADFRILVQETIGKKASENIEWSNPRLLCIAGDFTKYDEHAVQQINRNIELIRYVRYPEDLFLLELVNAVQAGRAAEAPSAVVAGHTYKTVAQHIDDAPESLKDLFEELKQMLLSFGDDVQVSILKFYVSFKRIKNFACVELRPKDHSILAHLNLSPADVKLEKDFTRDVSKIGHYGTGDLEVRIHSKDDLERARMLFEKSYEAS